MLDDIGVVLRVGERQARAQFKTGTHLRTRTSNVVGPSGVTIGRLQSAVVRNVVPSSAEPQGGSRMSSSGPHLSIQESLYPDLTCFGCGHANPDGFHLRSYRDGDRTVATFTPRPEHDNGFGFLSGGIITTVLDCHTAAVVMWEAR
jgi:hypothetical protein